SPRDLGRRTFIAGTGAAVSAAMLPGCAEPTPDQTKSTPTSDQRVAASTRKLGPLEVSAIGFGCMNLAGLYLPPTERSEAVKVIRGAYDRGITFFDTAQTYGPYSSEEFVGEALQSVRDKIVIATKFGYEIDPDTRQVKGLNSRPDYIKRATEGSL